MVLQKFPPLPKQAFIVLASLLCLPYLFIGHVYRILVSLFVFTFCNTVDVYLFHVCYFQILMNVFQIGQIVLFNLLALTRTKVLFVNAILASLGQTVYVRL